MHTPSPAAPQRGPGGLVAHPLFAPQAAGGNLWPCPETRPQKLTDQLWALLRLQSTEERSVCLCWAKSKPKGPKGGAARWHKSQTARLCGEQRTPRTVRRDAGRRVCRASGAPGRGSSAPQEQSRWRGNELRARGGNGGRRGRGGGSGRAHVGRCARRRAGSRGIKFRDSRELCHT